MVLIAIEPDQNLIVGALETPDDIGKIVRCHLAIEQMLEALVTSHCKASVDKKTSFWSKVNLALAMGVPESICSSCGALNDLRNEIAHNSKANIGNTKSISEKFIRKVSEVTPALLVSNGEIHNRRSRVTHSLSFATATQGEKIVIASAFLSGLIGALPSMYRFGSTQLVIVAGVNL